MQLHDDAAISAASIDVVELRFEPSIDSATPLDDLARPPEILALPFRRPTYWRTVQDGFEIGNLVDDLDDLGARRFVGRLLHLLAFSYLLREPFVVCHLANEIRYVRAELLH